MRRTPGRALRTVLLLAASPWFFACGSGGIALPEPAIPLSHVEQVSPRRDASIDEFLPWAEEQSRLIVVDKTARTLALYRHGKPVKTYPVVLGRNPGRKAVEGDRRTPSGLYRIAGKRVHPKYDRFLAIDYPNDGAGDRYAAERSRTQSLAVLGQSSGRGRGGQIGIHGSDNEDLNRLGINWTFGCVSLANRDIEDLYPEVDEGTLVMIFDDQQP
ncbi:MAG TPA: L,D-transpeptidase [Candidatus Binatia bacterium]|nr:L,D-transpeptidase [Candidatus Binatia bacterium]